MTGVLMLPWLSQAQCTTPLNKSVNSQATGAATNSTGMKSQFDATARRTALQQASSTKNPIAAYSNNRCCLV